MDPETQALYDELRLFNHHRAAEHLRRLFLSELELKERSENAGYGDSHQH